MPVISIENLTKQYGKTTALSHIHFTVDESEIFGLVGPDGAGKTSLFNILTTLILPTEGKVSILEFDLIHDYKKIRKNIGYLPGVFSLYPDLTVQENLIFFATMYGAGIKENIRMIAPIWKQIVPFKNRQAGKLSGGMKQKLALCCALIHKPQILFLDEPTTGVDPVSRREFWDLLREIKKYGVTVVVSTPYMDEATRCDRIALIMESKIITIDTPQNIISRFQGKLFALKAHNNIFQLLETLKEFPVQCNFYPYGEYLHISFDNFKGEEINELEHFLQKNNLSYSELKEISPIIEDCFIQLVKKQQNV